MRAEIAENPPVVDANVAIKWYLPEVHFEKARLLVEGNHFSGHRRLQIPDLLFPECANILWKRLRRGEIDRQRANTILEALIALPFEVHPHQPLMQTAFSIAASTDRSAYDSLYLALAVREQTKLITADAKLFHGLSGGPLAAYLIWIEDVEEIL